MQLTTSNQSSWTTLLPYFDLFLESLMLGVIEALRLEGVEVGEELFIFRVSYFAARALLLGDLGIYGFKTVGETTS